MTHVEGVACCVCDQSNHHSASTTKTVQPSQSAAIHSRRFDRAISGEILGSLGAKSAALSCATRGPDSMLIHPVIRTHSRSKASQQWRIREKPWRKGDDGGRGRGPEGRAYGRRGETGSGNCSLFRSFGMASAAWSGKTPNVRSPEAGETGCEAGHGVETSQWVCHAGTLCPVCRRDNFIRISAPASSMKERGSRIGCPKPGA